MWFYRHKFSHGPGHWNFIEADDKEELETLTDNYSNSEHYRGIEYVEVKSLPEMVIKEKLERTKMRIESLKKEMFF